jgi:uncharacterized protein YlaI
VLCDKIDKIDDNLPLAKRLRNRPIHTYMCDSCHERITTRTEVRKATGDFQLSHHKEEESDWV